MRTKLTFLLLIIASVIAIKALSSTHTQLKVNASALAEVCDAS